jgi:16S rRNA (guanine527-N7)-methyltransferase
MDLGQIAALLEPFSSIHPTASQLNCISIYVDILLRWNRKINLTAVRDPEQIVLRHFGESLFTAQQLFLQSGTKSASGGWSPHLVDVGSGAGFPGLPTKIFMPEIRLTLIESNHKKVAFLREVIRVLKLTDAQTFADRAERFPAESADVVTLRAVESFEKILPVAAAITADKGRLALLIGQAQVERVWTASPQFTWSDPVPVPLSSARVLLVGSRSIAGVIQPR